MRSSLVRCSLMRGVKNLTPSVSRWRERIRARRPVGRVGRKAWWSQLANGPSDVARRAVTSRPAPNRRHTCAESYVLSWCKRSRFRRLERWRGFWVKLVRFNELFDWARKTQNIIFDAGKDGLEGLRAGDPRFRLGSTTANADLRVRKPSNSSRFPCSR